MSERYPNKRALHRSGGKFAKATPADYGIGGVCPECSHLLVRHYDGDVAADQNAGGIDPRKFRYRCLNCEPRTEAEVAEVAAKIEAGKERTRNFFAAIERDEMAYNRKGEAA